MGDSDVSTEIFRRFTICAKKEVDLILKDYKHLTTAEFEDLLQIALMSLVIALRSYAFLGAFYNYWVYIARHDMLEHIEECSVVYFEDNQCITRIEGEPSEGYIMASDEDLCEDMSNNWFIERIEDILSKPEENNLIREDVELFNMYFVRGIDYKDIAEMKELKYFTVRNKIQKVREKLVFILFNSKE